MIGFGGAFTDAAGINIKSLSDAAQQNFMQSYFGSNGQILI
jgi:glucosylceramidase